MEQPAIYYGIYTDDLAFIGKGHIDGKTYFETEPGYKVNTDAIKLFDYALALLTAKLHSTSYQARLARAKNLTIEDIQVRFRYIDFFRAKGLPVDADPEKVEATEKEKARNQYKSRKRTTKSDLEALCHTRFELPINQDLQNVRTQEALIDGTGKEIPLFKAYTIDNGWLTIRFSPVLVRYHLVRGTMTKVPASLFSCSPKGQAYFIGKKLCSRYYSRTLCRDRISVKALLEASTLGLPVPRKSWIDRQKEPLEDILDKLYQCQVLTDDLRVYDKAAGKMITLTTPWTYGYSNGFMLPDEDLEKFFEDSEIWKNLKIYFNVAIEVKK